MRYLILLFLSLLISPCTFASSSVSDQEVVTWLHQEWLTIYDDLEDFRPDDFVTRWEASKFTTKLAELLWLEKTYTSCDFSDIDNYDSTLIPFIQSACAYGLLKWSNNLFWPNDLMSEAHAVTLVVRTREWFLDESGTYRWQQYYLQWQKMSLITDEQLSTLDQNSVSRITLWRWFYIAAHITEEDIAKSTAKTREEISGTQQYTQNLSNNEMYDVDRDPSQIEENTWSNDMNDVPLTRYMLYTPERYAKALEAQKYIVFNFRASRCPTCRATSTQIIENQDKLPESVIVLEVDFDEYQILRETYDVQFQTTFVFLDPAWTFIKKTRDIRNIDDLLEELEM